MRRSDWWAVALFCLVSLQGVSALAGHARLKNGLFLEGTPVPLQSLNTVVRRPPNDIVAYPILMVDTGLQRYYVSARQVLEVNQDVDLAQYETFRLQQRRTGRALRIQLVGAIVSATPFDEFGRRRVRLQTPRGTVDVVQGITLLHPRYVRVEALNYSWEFSLATTSIPPDVLDKILRRQIDPDKPQDRLAVARFYLQAGLYMRAQAELDAVRREFPELTEQVDELTRQVRQLVGEQIAAELRRRQQAGQHFLAYTAAKQFPTRNLSGDVLRQVRELIEQYEQRREDIETCRMLLGDLQAELSKPELVETLAPMRAEVCEQLNHETVSRLAAFLQLRDDPTLSAEEKLALAYSGWVLGSTHAVTDLETAIRLWKARFLLLQYLRTDDPVKRRQLLADLHELEGLGFERVLQLIDLLPPPLEPPSTEPGVPIRVTVPLPVGPSGSSTPTSSQDTAEDQRPELEYHVLLPPEYTPHHRYPAIVALHAAREPLDHLLTWWGGTREHPLQAQRHGYIVLVPEYASEGQHTYDYSPAAHARVLLALRDARKRYSIDSDRVFLSGLGMGAEAAFDIGMSHPDVFAGVVAISGTAGGLCTQYFQNARALPWYVVCGELDDDVFERNSSLLNRMLRSGYDLVLAEYVGRGHESFYEEIHRLFEWMGHLRRQPLPKQFKVSTLRPTDNRFYWLQVEGFPEAFRAATKTGVRRDRPLRPLSLEARVAAGNTDRNLLQVRSGTDKTTLWLSPQVVDFDKRVAVRLNGRYRFNQFVRPDVETLLEDLRVRGDRQRLFWARLEFD